MAVAGFRFHKNDKRHFQDFFLFINLRVIAKDPEQHFSNICGRAGKLPFPIAFFLQSIQNGELQLTQAAPNSSRFMT